MSNSPSNFLKRNSAGVAIATAFSAAVLSTPAAAQMITQVRPHAFMSLGVEVRDGDGRTVAVVLTVAEVLSLDTCCI